jgi:hypothetical protein
LDLKIAKQSGNILRRISILLKNGVNDTVTKIKTDGYLLLITHDQDELDATFFPLEGSLDLLNKLQKVYPTDANDIYLEAWNEWIVNLS